MPSSRRDIKIRAVPLLVAVTLILVAGCSEDPTAPAEQAPAWEWLNPAVAGDGLIDLWAASPSDVIAVGRNGTIIHFDGARCRRLDSGSSAHLHAIWGVGPGDYVVVGRDATALRGGRHGWSRIPLDEPVSIHGIWAQGPDDVFVLGSETPTDDRDVSPSSVVLRLRPGGWERIELPPGDSPACIFGFAPDRIHCGEATSLMHLYDGAAWSRYSMALPGEGWHPGVYALSGLPSGDLYAVGNSGTVRRYDGRARVLPDLGASVLLWDVWAADSTAVWVAGSYNGGLAACFDGHQWHSWRMMGAGALMAIHGPSPDLAFAVTSGGALLRYDAGRWVMLNGYSSRPQTTVWGAAPDDVYVGGVDGLYRFDGRVFARVAPGLDDVSRVWGTAPDDVHAVGVSFTAGVSGVAHFDGTSWRHDADAPLRGDRILDGCVVGDGDLVVTTGWAILRRGPSGWVTEELPPGADFVNSLAPLAGDRVLAAGSGGTILLGDAGGWTLEDSGTDDDLICLWVADPDHAYAASREGLVLERTGGSWRIVGDFGPGPVTALWGRSATEVFAAAGGVVHRFDGAAWSVAADPPGWTPGAAWEDGTGTLYLVGAEGMVLRGRIDPVP
ncbi:MAG: hypothetical protein IH621_02970 [Krumholzibacteria bacterium]|nr:hypothetical protein [Candidatus Krumholzibacteria bacterium]